MARALAPEDIRAGEFVSVMHVLTEHVPLLWEGAAPPEPVRRMRLPWAANPPVQVVEVCLPFVLVRHPKGKHRVLDVRRFRLARVSEQFGRRVFDNIAADERGAKSEKEE